MFYDICCTCGYGFFVVINKMFQLYGSPLRCFFRIEGFDVKLLSICIKIVALNTTIKIS